MLLLVFVFYWPLQGCPIAARCWYPIETKLQFIELTQGESLPTGAGIPQPVTQPEAPLFTPVMQPPAAPWSQQQKDSISWADRCLTSKQVSIHAQAVGTDDMDVKSTSDRFTRGPEPSIQPSGQAALPLVPPSQTQAPSSIHLNTMPLGAPQRLPVSRHTRAPSGIEMKDAYADNDLDDDW